MDDVIAMARFIRSFLVVTALASFVPGHALSQETKRGDADGQFRAELRAELGRKDTHALEQILVDNSVSLTARREAVNLLGERADAGVLPTLDRVKEQLWQEIRMELGSASRARLDELWKLGRAIAAAELSIRVSGAKTWEEKLSVVEGMFPDIPSHPPFSYRECTEPDAARGFLDTLDVTDENEAAIVARLGTNKWNLRYSLLRCLGRSKRDSARRAIEDHLRHPENVSLGAVEVLAKIGSEKSVPIFEDVASNAAVRPDARCYAMQVLSKLGKLSPDMLDIIAKTDDPRLAACAYITCRADKGIREAAGKAVLRLGAKPIKLALDREEDRLVRSVLRETLSLLGHMFVDAAGGGDIEKVRHLLNTGENVNVRDPFTRCTGLHTAAGNGHKEVVEELITKGANVNAKDKEGKTPLDYAKTEDMKALLRQHGGKSGKEVK